MGTLGTNTPYTTQDILNAVSGTMGSGGQAALQMVTPGVVGTITGTTQGYQTFVPAGSIVVTLMSAFVAGSGATGTASSTVTGLANAKDLDVFVSVTDYTGAATGSLLIFVDGRIDGTNYVSIAQATIITTIGQAFIHLTKRNPAGQVAAALSVDAGAGTTRAFGFGDALRVRRQITGTATTTFSGAIYITNIMA